MIGLALISVTLLAGAACTQTETSDALRAKFSHQFEQENTGPTSCPVRAIRLYDESDGKPTSWWWELSDGSTSTEQNPTFETDKATLTVTLTISHGDREDTVNERVTTTEC